jgi:hypothetical protein
MAMKNVPLFKPAMAIAIRQYIINSKGVEEEIYQSLEQCQTDPYMTYVTEYMDKQHPLKGYIVHGIHQTETVATLMDKLDTLIDDITSTIDTFQNPPEQTSDDTSGIGAFEQYCGDDDDTGDTNAVLTIHGNNTYCIPVLWDDHSLTPATDDNTNNILMSDDFFDAVSNHSSMFVTMNDNSLTSPVSFEDDELYSDNPAP